MPNSEEFSPIPSLTAAPVVTVVAAAPDATVLGVPVGTSGALPSEAGSDRAALALAGFDATVGSVLILPINAILVAGLALGKVGLDAYVKFIVPLMGILLVIILAVLMVGVAL